jgi:hypothetical protein
MTGLRMMDGINIERIARIGNEYIERLKESIKPLLENGSVKELPNGNIALTEENYFFADGIAAELFIIP